MKQPQVWIYLKVLWPIIRKYKLSFLNLFICVLVTSVIGMLYPYIFGLLVDEVFYHRNLAFLKVIVIGYGMIYLGEQGLHLTLNSVWSYLVTRFSFDIRKKLYEKILSLKASFFQDSQTGDLMTIINRDAREVMELIHWNIFYLSANVLRLLTALAFVFYINIYIGLMMVIVIPIVVITTLFFSRKMKTGMNTQRSNYGRLMSWCVEMLSGMRGIRLSVAQNYTSRQFVRHVIAFIRSSNSISRVQFISERTVSFITLCSDLALYTVASLLIVHGQLTVGGFIAMIEYFSRANGLLKNLSGANGRLQQNKVSLERMFHLFDEEEEKLRGSSGKPLVITDGAVEFRDVTFQYQSGTPVLDSVSFRINGGEKIAVVGRSGAGKSTLVSLLLRFYEPAEGRILIDGIPIDECSLFSLRKQIGVSLQEPTLFEGTIRDNLRWGSKSVSDAALWEACDSAAISSYIKTLPRGFDTLVGGSGIMLSGGQKQRIAIARTFIKKPGIFVFDEATSALDGESEAAVKQGWRETGWQVTTIIIAHRLSTILDANRVAVLEEGRIVAFGPHSELLNSSSMYRKLFLEQYSEHKEVASL
jgi:ATP-binding cassette subfamily B protein